MTAMTERIGLVCHAREYDLRDSEHYALHYMWVQSVSRWGVESPPAVGCLLELARAAWCDPKAYVASDCETVRALGGKGWTFWSNITIAPLMDGATELEALVAALEAAP